ncbi:MAG: hypothetical protein DYG85_17795 [Chloroflexi bacterium CFX1]|nr:hypothetical protein [Chloroflexi bacterium CFX1]
MRFCFFIHLFQFFARVLADGFEHKVAWDGIMWGGMVSRQGVRIANPHHINMNERFVGKLGKRI